MERTFNGLGQLSAEYQSLSGQVNTAPGGTPSVQYVYAGPGAGANYSRVTAVTYPDGRQVHYIYNPGIDDAISRVSAIADDDGSGNPSTAHLADYSYLGPDTVVTEGQGNGNALTYVTQAGDTTNAIQAGDPRFGGDQYSGLDRFGRVVDQNYVSTATGTTGTGATAPASTDRFQMGYDPNSNPLFRANLVNPSFGELYHANAAADGDNGTAYDPLDRLTNFARGSLFSSGHNGPASPTATYAADTVTTANTLPDHAASWSLDSLGNWSSSTTDTTTTLRTNDQRNEQTSVGPATLGFDSNGDTTTDEQGRNLIYDAWGDLTGVVNAATSHQTTYTTDALGRRGTQQDGVRTDDGPVLVVNNGSVQRSMVDSLTVVFPASAAAPTVTLTQRAGPAGAAGGTISTAVSNPSGDGRTWLISFTGTLTGGSLADGVYDLSEQSGATSQSYTFHRLFGDIDGNKTVNAADYAQFSRAFGTSVGSPAYDPAFDWDHNGTINSLDYSKFTHNNGTSVTYDAPVGPGPVLSGPSTTAPAGQTDISSWAASNGVSLYNDSAGRVIEERPAGAAGASKQFVWGLSYVNDLLEQDTATAVDAGGVLPNQHLLTYALDPSFNSTGTLVGPAGSYDSVAIQSADEKVVVAGVSGTNLVISRYKPTGAVDTTFGSSGTVTLAETSPTFCRLALDAAGNIIVAVDNGGSVQVSRLNPAGALDTSFNATGQTTVTFAGVTAVPQAITLQADGKIDVVADSSAGTGLYLARLNTDGTLDGSFGSGGLVSNPIAGSSPSGLSIALDAAGDLLVGGSDGGDMSVVRLTPAGSADTSFNGTGEAKADFNSGSDAAYAVSPGPHGTIVAAGTSNSSGTYNHALARFSSSGALDGSFGTGGKVVGVGGTGVIRAMLVEPNGSILAGGDASGTTAQKVWKFTSSGAADSEFASGGSITANSGATVYGWAITSGPTQRVVVAGSYNGNAALAAFAPASLRLYAQHDANYDVTALADANGTVQERFVYDPYGSVQVLSPQWQPTADTFGAEYLFQGMRYDPATGLYHTPNRDYSTSLGRWLQMDPAGYIDGSDLYQADDSSPATQTDPSGLLGAADVELEEAAEHAGQAVVESPTLQSALNEAFTWLATPGTQDEAGSQAAAAAIKWLDDFAGGKDMRPNWWQNADQAAGRWVDQVGSAETWSNIWYNLNHSKGLTGGLSYPGSTSCTSQPRHSFGDYYRLDTWNARRSGAREPLEDAILGRPSAPNASGPQPDVGGAGQQPPNPPEAPPAAPGEEGPNFNVRPTFKDNFASKVKSKLNQLRKKYPNVRPASQGGVDDAQEIARCRAAQGGGRAGLPVGADEPFAIYFEDGPVTWVFKPNGEFWSMRINNGWKP